MLEVRKTGIPPEMVTVVGVAVNAFEMVIVLALEEVPMINVFAGIPFPDICKPFATPAVFAALP